MSKDISFVIHYLPDRFPSIYRKDAKDTDPVIIACDIPEGPEFILRNGESPMFQRPGVSSAVPQPHIKTSIGQNEAQAAVVRVCDPVTRICQEAMLKIDNWFGT